jgi:hypothetical protein
MKLASQVAYSLRTASRSVATLNGLYTAGMSSGIRRRSACGRYVDVEDWHGRKVPAYTLD